MRLVHSILSAVLIVSLCTAAASDLRQIGMVNIPGPPGFAGLGFADGMLLMAHPGASAVDVFDPVHRRVVAQITGLQSPRAVVFDDQTGRVYISDHGSNSIVVVSTDGWKVLDSIALPGSPDALLRVGENLCWADPAAGTISLLDLHTKQDIAKTEMGGPPRTLVLDTARNLIFATVQDQHEVVALDPQLQIVKRFGLNGSQPTGLVFDPQHQELYVSVRGAVLAINAETGAEISRVEAPEGVDALCLDPDSRTLFAASEGWLLVMNSNGSLSLAEKIAADVKGHNVAYDPAKQLVLVPGGREGKSKLLILRPMSANGQPGADDQRIRVR
jgi:streptogramin lyase